MMASNQGDRPYATRLAFSIASAAPQVPHCLEHTSQVCIIHGEGVCLSPAFTQLKPLARTTDSFCQVIRLKQHCTQDGIDTAANPQSTPPYVLQARPHRPATSLASRETK